MRSGLSRPRVRLAELVAALSLGVDLGFGQPMEHVLRQCLIALRLGERIGLDEDERAVVYYTALLVNVGCHTDAHEQAKWFGDDIALKSAKYEYEFRSVRGAVAAVRRLGAGSPALLRFRLGLEFAVSGRRDFEGMIAHHAAMARSLGEELGLREEVLDALAAAYGTWDGRRPAREPGEAAAELRGEVKAGRLDADAVEAVLGAAGHRVSRRREGPAGLTPREVEVLRLLARGLSNKQIGASLVIAPKTVGNHIEHIYAKTGASNRAGAGLFAMQHGLLPEEELLAAPAGNEANAS